MFKVNNKNTRATTNDDVVTYFTHFSSISIVDFEQVNVSWALVQKDFLKVHVSYFFVTSFSYH